ncbi:MAG: type I-C CRISPR-associated protein Cas8c/Csd1 [Methylococcales bacterium]
MILQSLVNYYDRLSTQQGVLPPYGWSWEKISYCIVLKTDGSIHNIDDLRIMEDEEKVIYKPRILMVPMLPEGKTSGVKANYLWDNTAYTLGMSKKPEKLNLKFEAFWKQVISLEHDCSAAIAAMIKFKGHRDDNKLHLNKLIMKYLYQSSHWNEVKSKRKQLILSVWDDSSKWKNSKGYDRGHENKIISSPDWQKLKKRRNQLILDFLDSNIIFRFIEQNGYVHECPEFKTQWQTILAKYQKKLSSGQCLIEGDRTKIADLHIRIKGVDQAQSSGAYIVSFNKDSFESYGFKKGKNASIGTHTAFKYVTALNHLLRKEAINKQRLKIGDAITVFWAEAPDNKDAESAESFMSAAISPTDAQETTSLASLLQQVAVGIPLQTLRPDLNPLTKFYILGLSPNAARISVRFWYATTLNEFTERIAQHYYDLNLEPKPNWIIGLPKISGLIYATAPIYIKNGKKVRDTDRILPQLAGNLARSIFTGQAYPQSLLSQLLIRMRTDGVIDFIRISLCKAIINRQIRLKKLTNTKELSMSLDVEEKNIAYRMGRLFAVLESIQQEALGKEINATIRDRYWGAASATPALVFPMLERNMMNHLAKVRKESKIENRKITGQELANFFDWQIGQIKEGMDTLYPKNLNLEEQGRFAIGYYHQRYTRKIKTKTGGEVENHVAVGDEILDQNTDEQA